MPSKKKTIACFTALLLFVAMEVSWLLMPNASVKTTTTTAAVAAYKNVLPTSSNDNSGHQQHSASPPPPPPPPGQGKLHLVQVFSPFLLAATIMDKTGNWTLKPNPFYPLDLAQWGAMASIKRALKLVPTELMHVDVVCVFTESDAKVFRSILHTLPCHETVILSRTTKTVYPYFLPPKDLPFLQDLFQAAITATENKYNGMAGDNYYVMYANSDIGLHKNFYSKAWSMLRQREAITINRVEIHKAKLKMDFVRNNSGSYENWLGLVKQEVPFLETQLDLLIKTEPATHPGYDCFIVNHLVIKHRLHNVGGDMFLGYPPWGNALHSIFSWLATNYTNFQATGRNTFHLGFGETAWKMSPEKRRKDSPPPENEQLQRMWKQGWLIKFKDFCPALRNIGNVGVYGVQNAINCGRWMLHGIK